MSIIPGLPFGWKSLWEKIFKPRDEPSETERLRFSVDQRFEHIDRQLQEQEEMIIALRDVIGWMGKQLIFQKRLLIGLMIAVAVLLVTVLYLVLK